LTTLLHTFIYKITEREIIRKKKNYSILKNGCDLHAIKKKMFFSKINFTIICSPSDRTLILNIFVIKRRFRVITM